MRKRPFCVILYLKSNLYQDRLDTNIGKVQMKRQFRRARASGSRTASPQSHTMPILRIRKTLTSGRTPGLPAALLQWVMLHRAAALRRWRALSTSMSLERLSFKVSATTPFFTPVLQGNRSFVKAGSGNRIAFHKDAKTTEAIFSHLDPSSH
eukprot:COSAG02_NODE_27331_length_612_cov_0.789474_1_plen_151_part_10